MMEKIMCSLLRVVLMFAAVSMPVQTMERRVTKGVVKVRDFLDVYVVLGYRVLSATEYKDCLVAKSDFKAFLDRTEQLYVSAQLLDESIALGRRLLAVKSYEEHNVVKKDFEDFWLKRSVSPKL